MLSKLRDLICNLALHLFEVDVQFIAIDRAVGLELENDRNNVTAQRRLIEHAFNSVNRVLVCLVPQRGELVIILSPAISGIARHSGSLGCVRHCALSR